MEKYGWKTIKIVFINRGVGGLGVGSYGVEQKWLDIRGKWAMIMYLWEHGNMQQILYLWCV